MGNVLRDHEFGPPVARADNVFGDHNQSAPIPFSRRGVIGIGSRVSRPWKAASITVLS